MCNCKTNMRRRRHKLDLAQFDGDAGMWTIVETIQRPLMVVSDKYDADRLMREMEKEGRR